MENSNQILQLCRLCLVKDSVNIPIFEEQGDIRQIYLKISSCLPVKVSQDDELPKKICDGCSYKLDMVYDFRNTSVNAEKQLTEWLGQANLNSESINKNKQPETTQRVKTPETFVKQEAIDPSDVQKEEEEDDKNYMFQQNFEESSAAVAAGPSATATSNEEEPPPKRAKRTAAVKASLALDQSDEDDDEDWDPITKREDESEGDSDADDNDEAPFVDVPSTSADDQPGPSGVGKDGVEAPSLYQHHFYTSNIPLDSLSSNLQLSSKYFEDISVVQKSSCMHEHIHNSSVVDHLNESDADFLNLLTTEEDCSAILHNIASDVQFDGLESAYLPTQQDIEQFIRKTCDVSSQVVPVETKNQDVFKCDRCEKEFLKKKLLKKHILVHTQERNFACTSCGKCFRQRYALKEHEKGHNKPTFQCDICSKMFKHRSHLNAHRKRHLDKYLSFCKDCAMGFETQAALRHHRNAYHENTRLICDVCGSQLSTLSALKEHKRKHDPSYLVERSHVCDICGRSYLTSRNLRSHMKIHSKFKPYKCSICGKSVSSKNILETHLKLHTGVKDFNCEICDKNFASKEYLKVHQRTHNGEKPFECTFCGKRFTQKTSLTVHIRYHTGQKPYKCECGKEFTTKSHLMTHYKTHDIGGVDIEYISDPFI